MGQSNMTHQLSLLSWNGSSFSIFFSDERTRFEVPESKVAHLYSLWPRPHLQEMHSAPWNAPAFHWIWLAGWLSQDVYAKPGKRVCSSAANPLVKLERYKTHMKATHLYVGIHEPEADSSSEYMGSLTWHAISSNVFGVFDVRSGHIALGVLYVQPFSTFTAHQLLEGGQGRADAADWTS